MKKQMFLILFVLTLAVPAWAEEMKTYYENGQVQMEMSDSGMKTYYESGKLMSQVELKDGQPAGISKYFHENGKLMREEDHAKGTGSSLMKTATSRRRGKFKKIGEA